MDFVVVWITLVLLHFHGVVPAWGLIYNDNQIPPNTSHVVSVDSKTPKYSNGLSGSNSYLNGNGFRAAAAEYFSNPQRVTPMNGLPSYINGHSDVVVNSKDEASLKENKGGGGGDSGDGGGGGGGVDYELQHATCQITTEQLVAAAEATMTKALSNICNSKDMEVRFFELEAILTKRIIELKDTISRLDTRINEQKETLNNGQQHLAESLAKKCKGPDERQIKSELFKPSEDYFTNNNKEIKVKILKNDEADTKFIRTTTLLHAPRDSEILRLNSTLHFEPSESGQKKVFTYYWKLSNIAEKMREWEPNRSIRSPSFNIYPGGYRMYLRIYPRQDGDKFFIHVGITKGDFDKDLKWPFALKHRVSVLDQAIEMRLQEDITSRVWDPTQLCSEFNWQKPTQGDNQECVGLGFPHDVLRQRSYIYNDSVIVKLTVYIP